ncbi:MAG: DUF4215 domain-containing protein, partial [archaeon]
GQGGFEYLLLIAGVVLVAVVAVLVLIPFSQEEGKILGDAVVTYDETLSSSAGLDGGDNGPPGNTPPMCVADNICDAVSGETAATCLVDCHCGDGVCELNLNETPTACSEDCSASSPICGNNVVESPEACDDGNNEDGDGCSAACEIESPIPACGNGIVNEGELCDDNNIENGDGCSSTCKLEEGIHYQYNAKFEPPIGRVIHGMGNWEEYNPQYVNLLTNESQTPPLGSLASPDLAPASRLMFILLDHQHGPWENMISNLSLGLNELDAQGIIPHASIGLFGELPSVIDPDNPYFGIDDEVANTTNWDSRINDLALVFKNYGKPVFLRITPEFSGKGFGQHPYIYPKAFRKMVQLFRDAGADNVAFVWCYYPADDNDFFNENGLGEYKWFPGDDVIDWYAIDVYTPDHISGPTTVLGGDSHYGKTLKFLQLAHDHGKPVYLPETGPSMEHLTSDLVDSQADWSNYFIPFFELIQTHSVIKGFNYVNVDWTTNDTYSALGWMNEDLTVSPYISEQYLIELNKSPYLHSKDRELQNQYTDYDPSK